jgi:hypothetical protein
MSRTSSSTALPVDTTIINLSQLLSRLEKIVLVSGSPENAELQKSSLERSRVAAVSNQFTMHTQFYLTPDARTSSMPAPFSSASSIRMRARSSNRGNRACQPSFKKSARSSSV